VKTYLDHLRVSLVALNNTKQRCLELGMTEQRWSELEQNLITKIAEVEKENG